MRCPDISCPSSRKTRRKPRLSRTADAARRHDPPAGAGSYSWLPVGLRVLNKVNQIIREEQNRSGAIEILMPTIQSADLWRESGRYDAYGKEMLRIKDRQEREFLYGPTNEEWSPIFSAPTSNPTKICR